MIFRRPHKRVSGEQHRDAVFAPITFSEDAGVRYLHFGTEWIQGAMRLSQPDSIELEYAQQMMIWMLFLDEPEHLAQLGLGAATLTKFTYRQFPAARVTAVELNPDVITAAHSMFRLPGDDERLTVVEEDAATFVADFARRASIDVLQVDLYDALARGPVLDSENFYRGCRNCLRTPGIMTVNLFGDHPSFRRNISALHAAFDRRVVVLPEVHEGNRVAIAFKGPPLDVPFAILYARADAIQDAVHLPAPSWVNLIKSTDASAFTPGRFSI